MKLVELSLFFVCLRLVVGDVHGKFWYNPSNWAIGWKKCTLDRLSRRGTETTYLPKEAPTPQISYSDEELRSRLSEKEYWITQKKGTEDPWSGEYVHRTDDGIYRCKVCGAELFHSDTKYESGCGWPSFTDVAKDSNIVRVVDTSCNELRTEVVCGQCGAHLGHVFDDGPTEKETDTGLRYCINSASLNFVGS